MFSRLLLATALVIGLPTCLYAQQHGGRRAQAGRQPTGPAQATKIEGTVQAATRGGIVVLDNENRVYEVAVPSRGANVEVTGPAPLEYLQKGQTVDFKAEIDDHGAIKEKVGELTIVSASSEKGVFSPESGSRDGKDGDETGVFGAAPASGRGGKPMKPAKSAKDSGKGPLTAGLHRIVGKLMIDHDGNFTVLANRNKLPFHLSDKATLSVDFDDYTVATKDSKITVEALVFPGPAGAPPQAPHMAVAQEVKIEMVDPIVMTPKKKGSSAKSEGKRPAKHPKKDEGLPEPAAEK